MTQSRETYTPGYAEPTVCLRRASLATPPAQGRLQKAGACFLRRGFQRLIRSRPGRERGPFARAHSSGPCKTSFTCCQRSGVISKHSADPNHDDSRVQPILRTSPSPRESPFSSNSLSQFGAPIHHHCNTRLIAAFLHNVQENTLSIWTDCVIGVRSKEATGPNGSVEEHMWGARFKFPT